MTMARRGLRACLVLAVAMAAGGCSKDQEVNATLAEIDAFTAELVKRADTGDPSAGVNEAQRYFDEHKASLKPRLAALMKVRGFEITEETKKKITECAARNASAVMSLRIKHTAHIMQDPTLGTRLEKLSQDFNALLTTP